ncbi:MAG: hypothetical protein WCH85_10045, partial [Methanomicrobiales archaeon]
DQKRIGENRFALFFGGDTKPGDKSVFFPQSSKRAVLRGFPDIGMANGARIMRICPQGLDHTDGLRGRIRMWIIQDIPVLIIPLRSGDTGFLCFFFSRSIIPGAFSR